MSEEGWEVIAGQKYPSVYLDSTIMVFSRNYGEKVITIREHLTNKALFEVSEREAKRVQAVEKASTRVVGYDL